MKMKKVILLKEGNKYSFFSWPKSLKFEQYTSKKKKTVYCRLSLNADLFFSRRKIFKKEILFISSFPLMYIKEPQIFSFKKVMKRKISKKLSFLFLKSSSILMFRKPAEVRMGNGKGQKLNKRIFQINYGSPFVSSLRLSVKFSPLVRRKIYGKLGFSPKILDLRKFFFLS